MKKKGCVCLGAALFMLVPVAGAVADESLFRMPSLKLGVVKFSGNMEASRDGQFSDVPFSSSMAVSPLVTLIQDPVYFSDTSRWGYHTEISGGYFNLDYDDDDHSGFVDGELKGFSVALTPVLFYLWGDRELCHSCKSWRIEAGAGVNYLYADGELNKRNDQKLSFDSSGLGFNAHLGAVANYKQWEIGLRLVVPTKVDDDDVSIEHSLSSVSLGYRF